VPSATIDRLTIIYSLVYLVIAVIGALMFRRFPFGRAEHEARLARLSGAAIIDAAPREP
jgi:GPH family glycoside/pentoside/hexuronide:cation symporter